MGAGEGRDDRHGGAGRRDVAEQRQHVAFGGRSASAAEARRRLRRVGRPQARAQGVGGIDATARVPVRSRDESRDLVMVRPDDGGVDRVSVAAARSRRIGEPPPARHSATTMSCSGRLRSRPISRRTSASADSSDKPAQLDRLALTPQFTIGRGEHEGGVGRGVEDRQQIVGRADQVVGDDADPHPGQQPPQLGRAGPESGGVVRAFEDLLRARRGGCDRRQSEI